MHLQGMIGRADGHVRVLTPHPGEMARLMSKQIQEIQESRIESARQYAETHGLVLVLKGYRTVIAFPDGRAGSIRPARRHSRREERGHPNRAHRGDDRAESRDAGRRCPGCGVSTRIAGQRAAQDTYRTCVLATDLLHYLPEAMRECATLSDHSEEDTIELGRKLATELTTACRWFC